MNEEDKDSLLQLIGSLYRANRDLSMRVQALTELLQDQTKKETTS